MKAFKAIAVSSIILFSFVGNAALAAPTGPTQTMVTTERTEKSFGLTLEPVWLLIGGVGAKVEYFISEKVSIGLGGMIIPKRSNDTSSSSSSSSTTVTSDPYKYSKNEVLLGTNIMITGTLASRGLYINPSVGYAVAEITEYGTQKLSGSASTTMARLTMGYQWIIAKSLRLAAGGGLTAYENLKVVVKDSAGKELLTSDSSATGLALDLQVGYVF